MEIELESPRKDEIARIVSYTSMSSGILFYRADWDADDDMADNVRLNSKSES